jgi:hypothetical protein
VSVGQHRIEQRVQECGQQQPAVLAFFGSEPAVDHRAEADLPAGVVRPESAGHATSLTE